MCGIIGYIGDKQAQPILLNCLKRVEYRGYDSCGIAVSGSGIEVYKDVTRVRALEEAIPQFDGTAGIGHTRWATCGEPSQVNAHPHCDCTGNIAVVHNGVIDNFEKLRQQLISVRLLRPCTIRTICEAFAPAVKYCPMFLTLQSSIRHFTKRYRTMRTCTPFPIVFTRSTMFGDTVFTAYRIDMCQDEQRKSSDVRWTLSN